MNIENRITFKIKTRCYLELLMPETMKLLGSTKSKTTKDKNGELVLINCNIVNNNSQRNSKVLYTYVPNILLGQLLDISSKNFIILKTFNPEFSYTEVWLTDQTSNPLEIEDKINITLVINKSIKYKKWQTIQFNLEIEYL